MFTPIHVIMFAACGLGFIAGVVGGEFAAPVWTVTTAMWVYMHAREQRVVDNAPSEEEVREWQRRVKVNLHRNLQGYAWGGPTADDAWTLSSQTLADGIDLMRRGARR